MILLKKDIKKLVSYYVRKYDTSNPFEIADALGIIVQIGRLGFEGCYMFLKNHRCIFLNEDLSEHDRLLVMSHELGHAILHSSSSAFFLHDHTYYARGKFEREANLFAAELLIDTLNIDTKSMQNYSLFQLASTLNVPMELLKYKFNIL